MRSKARLGREITVLLVVKALVIAGLFFAFFSPSHRIHPDRQAVVAHLLDAQTQ